MAERDKRNRKAVTLTLNQVSQGIIVFFWLKTHGITEKLD